MSVKATDADRDHVVFRTFRRKDNSVGIDARTPRDVVPIDSAEELEAQLAHYAKQLFRLTTPDSREARRYYVELIRPALRYYCRRFQRSVPDWLKDDSFYKDMPEPERKAHFGVLPLRIKEFKKPQPLANGGGPDDEEASK